MVRWLGEARGGAVPHSFLPFLSSTPEFAGPALEMWQQWLAVECGQAVRELSSPPALAALTALLTAPSSPHVGAFALEACTLITAALTSLPAAYRAAYVQDHIGALANSVSALLMEPAGERRTACMKLLPLLASEQRNDPLRTAFACALQPLLRLASGDEPEATLARTALRCLTHNHDENSSILTALSSQSS